MNKVSAPVNDFVRNYKNSGTLRFHMPGHKGTEFHGCEALDITEIKGADYLYDASGIIGESEAQTAKAFGAGMTLYSTEGSSQCIKAMLGIIALETGIKHPKVLAPRNVHKAFIDACILLDLEVLWLYPNRPSTSVCCCDITPQQIETALAEHSDISCCYVTSPDYLGNIADIPRIAEICHSKSVPLLVDNAHGAYTAFLEENTHPIALGADMCCDSAHKTLPCYTGTAYLHISKNAPKEFSEKAKRVMSMFGSTSPSYLLLQSLDLCSHMLCTAKLPPMIKNAAVRTAVCKSMLEQQGWKLAGSEKLKITIFAAKCGYTGTDLADLLRHRHIEPEYCDLEFLVLMTGVTHTKEDFDCLVNALGEIPVLQPLELDLPTVTPCERKMTMRAAAFCKSQAVPVTQTVGRTCALTVTACQPSVPVIVSGEVIDASAVKLLQASGITTVNVI